MNVASQEIETNRFRFIQWDITARCNLACIHCRSESFYGDKDLERDMPLNAVKRRLEDLYVNGIRRIHFLGGEPFARGDLPEIVHHATQLGILCSVNTNGTMITQERAEAIVEAGTYLLTFSIDGADAETNDYIRGKGTFFKTLRGIQHVLAAKQRLHGSTRLICSHVLMRSNYETVTSMVGLCTEIGLQNLIVTNLRRMGGAAKIFEELALTDDERMDAAERLASRISEGHCCNVQIEIVPLLGQAYLNVKYGVGLEICRGGCDAITSKAYMQPDGALFPCQDVAKAIAKSRERQNIKSEGLASWESDRYSSISKALTSRKLFESYVPCRSCPALGNLCTPCPLAGLSGRSVSREPCLYVLRRAKREGVDSVPLCRKRPSELPVSASSKIRCFAEVSSPPRPSKRTSIPPAQITKRRSA